MRQLLSIHHYPLSIIFLIFPLFGYAQSIDTLQSPITNHQFQTIEIIAPRLQSFQTGTKNTAFDAFQKITVETQDLGTALSLNTPIFIKNYGPGRLATTAIRGASAAQIAVIWNGFNLNSPMLGQADFSLIPAYFMDNIALQYGSNSASWGSGAVGGAVILENKSIFNQGWQANWNSAIASFGNFFNGLSTNYSNQKIANGTKIFYQTGKNNFPIENGQAKNLPHSQISKWGILQKNGFKIKDNQQLNFNLWYQTADRNLPPNLVQQKSVAKQEDESFRGVVNWQIIDNQSIISIRSALFYERLFFQDVVADIDSRSRTWTSSSEIEWTKAFSTQHSINIGSNYSYLKAISNNYNKDNPTQNRVSIFAMYQWKSASKKWQTQLSLRQEWIDSKTSPFIPAIGFEGKLLKQLLLRGNISRSYRNPTFNDLFWQFSGQQGLLSEDGWNQELGLNYTFNKQWHFSTTAYNRAIDNWIIWLPKNGVWIPQNLQKVWSRGMESTLNWQQQYNAVKVHFSLNYDLTFSTNQKGTSTQDASIGKQLIYVPKHKLNASVQIEWKDWRLAFYHLYTDRVYTLSDNSDFLPAYHLNHFFLYKNLKIKNLKGNAFVKFNNIFGVNYQVVAQFAMPKQNVEFGWKIGF